jgi:hypothetical protein
MSHTPPPGPAASERLFRNACREARVSALVWLLALVWTVGWCWLRGYPHPSDSWLVTSGLAMARPAQDATNVLGFPGWVFYGIMLPWVACTLFTVVYALWGMPDDDLGAEQEGSS